MFQSAALTIDASLLTDGITISGNNASRIFGVTQKQTITLNNITLTKGHTTANSTTYITDCDISTTPTFTRGGGFYANGNTTLNNSTISQNQARHATAEGEGVFVWSNSAIITLNSTLLSGNGTDNFASPSYNTPTLNANNSLFGDNETEITGSGGVSVDNFFNSSPRLIGLDDNGCAVTTSAGCVHTHEPAAGSLAIDNGATNGQTTDQRGAGFMRPLGGTQADIGAFETIPVVIPAVNPFGECDGVVGINTQDVTCTIDKMLNPPAP